MVKDADIARLFRAMHGNDPGPDAQTRKTAARRLVFSEDGLTLIKHFSPCLRTFINASSNVSHDHMEGRRSVLLELIRLATGEGGA